MDLSALFKRAGQVAAENSPAILTAIGVTGTLTTAYLAARAGFQSVEVLKEAEEAKQADFLGDALQSVEEGEEPKGIKKISPEPLTAQEKFEATWKLYVPAAASAALTVAAIICANRISDRRTAALASAYSIVEKSYNEYRQKTLAKVGKKKEQEVRDEIAQDRVTKEPPTQSEIVIVNGGNTLCKDMWSGRYFTGDVEAIRKAVNDFNAKVINETHVALSEFLGMIGLPPTSGSDELGWNTDRLLEVDYSWTTYGDDPLLTIDFRTPPISKFASLY